MRRERRWQAKNLADATIADAIHVARQASGYTRAAFLSEVVEAVQARHADAPRKVIIAKLRSMVRRGAIDGCACGCSGNFAVLEHGAPRKAAGADRLAADAATAVEWRVASIDAARNEAMYERRPTDEEMEMSRVQWASLAIGKWCGVLRRRRRSRIAASYVRAFVRHEANRPENAHLTDREAEMVSGEIMRRMGIAASPFAGIDRSTAPPLAVTWKTQPTPRIIDTVRRPMPTPRPIALNPETYTEVERLLNEAATPRTWAQATPDQIKLVKMGPVFKLDEMSDEELCEIIRLIPPPRGNPA